jgi:hypothetical protein
MIRRLARPWTNRQRVLARVGYGIVGLIGYILSPASWWNDAFVNIPLSLGLAILAKKLLGTPLDLGFAAAYWATNILGVILMAIGFQGVRDTRVSGRGLVFRLVAATIYTIVMVAILRVAGLS